MKCVLFLLAAVALASGKPTLSPAKSAAPNNSIISLDMAKKGGKKMVKVEMTECLKDLYHYIQSDEFLNVAAPLLKLPSFNKLKNFILMSELHPVLLRVDIPIPHRALSSSPAPTTTLAPTTTTAPPVTPKRPTAILVPLPAVYTLKALMKFASGLISLEKLKESVNRSQNVFPNFKNFMKRIQSAEFKTILKVLKDQPEYLAMKKHLEGKGVDVNYIIKVAKTVLGL